jgi:hypothetical protein
MKVAKALPFRHILAAALAGCIGATAHSANLLGDSLLVERNWPTPFTTYVAPIEIDVLDPINYGSIGSFDIAIDATTVMATYTGSSYIEGSATVFDGFVFSGFSSAVTGASLIGGGMPVYSLTYTPTAIYLNLGDGVGAPAVGPGDFVKFSVSVVPEPGTFALALAGLALVGRKTRKARPTSLRSCQV